MLWVGFVGLLMAGCAAGDAEVGGEVRAASPTRAELARAACADEVNQSGLIPQLGRPLVYSRVQSQERGADIVVTGRVDEPSETPGPFAFRCRLAVPPAAPVPSRVEVADFSPAGYSFTVLPRGSGTAVCASASGIWDSPTRDCDLDSWLASKRSASAFVGMSF